MFANATTNGVPVSMNVVPAGVNGGTSGGFFGDGYGGSWLWFLIIIVLLFGWGNNGWGGYGGGNAGGQVGDNYILATDMASLSRQISDSTSMTERKLDGVNNGLCDGFYAQNTTMLNGFNGVNQAIAESNYAIQNGLTQGQIAAMQNQNALQTQISQCCCDNKAALKDLQYNMATLNNGTNNIIGTQFADLNYRIATEDCTTRRTITDNTRDVIASQEGGTREILAAINSLKTDALQDKIAALQAENQTLKFAASQADQNVYITTSQAAQTQELINKICPAPIPSYIVPAPFQYCNCNNNGCNCGC